VLGGLLFGFSTLQDPPVTAGKSSKNRKVGKGLGIGRFVAMVAVIPR
jgi:hypothetical protein